MRLELLGQTGVFERPIGGVLDSHASIHDDIAVSNRAKPNFVIAFALFHKVAATVTESLAEFPVVPCHRSSRMGQRKRRIKHGHQAGAQPSYVAHGRAITIPRAACLYNLVKI